MSHATFIRTKGRQKRTYIDPFLNAENRRARRLGMDNPTYRENVRAIMDSYDKVFGDYGEEGDVLFVKRGKDGKAHVQEYIRGNREEEPDWRPQSDDY